VERRFDVAPTTNAAGCYLEVRVSAQRPISTPVFLDPGAGYSPGPMSFLVLDPRASASIFFLRTSSVRRVRFAVPPASTLCLNALDLVTLHPSPH
jgi:hypothetical protein